MKTVDLTFLYTEQDYVRAMRAHYASRLRLPLDIAAIVGVAAFGTYELWSGSYVFGIAMLCFSGVFALILIAAFTIIPSIAFRSQAKFRDEYSLRFSPEGINFRTVHINSDLQWNLYTSALVDAYSFILYYGSRQFTIIPKRVFQDVMQCQTFEQLLAENVPNIVDKTK